MYKVKIQGLNETKEICMVDCWEDMTIQQFVELNQILTADIPDTYRAVNLVSVLTNIPVDELEGYPVTLFSRLNSRLEFLNTPIPKVKHQNEYVLNGRKYILDADISAISTAQYIDYQEYIKENNPIQIMSLWLIPEGHKYNDGYSIEKVMLDIQDMKMLDVQAVAFFLQHQFATYILILADYSKKEMKKMKMKKKDIQRLQTLLNNMASSLLS